MQLRAAQDHLEALEGLLAATPHHAHAAPHLAALRQQLGGTAQPVLWSRVSMALRTELDEDLDERQVELRFVEDEELPFLHADPDHLIAGLTAAARALLAEGRGDALIVHGTVVDGAVVIAMDLGEASFSMRCRSCDITSW